MLSRSDKRSVRGQGELSVKSRLDTNSVMGQGKMSAIKVGYKICDRTGRDECNQGQREMRVH